MQGGYSLAGLLLLFLGAGSVYIVLRAELDKSTDLFLADKLHVAKVIRLLISAPGKAAYAARR